MAIAFQTWRLLRAREEGFLNARCRVRPALLRAYGLWCWRMSIPMVWYEARTPSSRLSRVHLDMLTTPYRLTVAGRAALIALSAAHFPPDRAVITADGAAWDRVPPATASDFARAVFRTVRRPASYQFLAFPNPATLQPDNVVPFAPPAHLASRADVA
jgi:hypothetical protein